MSWKGETVFPLGLAIINEHNVIIKPTTGPYKYLNHPLYFFVILYKYCQHEREDNMGNCHAEKTNVDQSESTILHEVYYKMYFQW